MILAAVLGQPKTVQGQARGGQVLEIPRAIAQTLAPRRRARLDAQVRRDVLLMELRELRQEAGKTQAEVAEIAEMTQAELSKFERREDHLLSTLRRYVAALGRKLEVVAVFDRKRIALKGV